MASKIGERLPDATLWEKNPEGAVKLREICAGKRCVVVGVPGPFTPVCSDSHLPGYLAAYDQFAALNVDAILFVSVVDPFVMSAWGRDRKVEDKVRVLADTQMELTKGLDVVLPVAAVLGSDRCQRFALMSDDNVIQQFFAEDDPGKLTVSAAEHMLQSLA